MWEGGNESVKYWLSIQNEIKNPYIDSKIICLALMDKAVFEIII